MSQRAIARQLRLSRTTVSRYIHGGAFPEMARRKQPRSMLAPYEPYLHRRWMEGCSNARQLWREIQAQGYPGAHKLVDQWATLRRPSPLPSPSQKPRAEGVLRPRSARQVVWLLLKQPDTLKSEEQQLLARVCQASADVMKAQHLAQCFLTMIRERTPETLLPWIESAKNSLLPDLQGFATGLLRDFDAVRAAVTVEWSNGQTEGQINRLKLIKRQMYGRASFDLLRQRVLAVIL
jgi:transposase